MSRHTGKTVIVTGAARGIGLAIARRFVAEGASVVACDIAPADFEAATADLASSNRLIFTRTDVTDPDSASRTIQGAVERFGGLDVLINNAGIVRPGVTESLALEDWRAVVDVDLNGVFIMTKAALPALKASRGNIINTASISGSFANTGLNAYYAAKAGVIGFTKYLAVENGPAGVRANAVSPGPNNSQGSGGLMDMPELVEWNHAHIPLGRSGVPADLTGTYSFLASDDAAYLTGQNITVDGGLTAWSGEADLSAILADRGK